MPESQTPLVKYMQSAAKASGPHSVVKHVLQQGRQFKSEPLNDVEQKFVSTIFRRTHPVKQCYRNCQIEALSLPTTPSITLQYVEGYVDPGIGYAIDHAWLSVNHKVVDPTMRVSTPGRRIKGLIPDGWAFYGIELDPEACQHALVHGASISLLDDYECGWPYIPGKAPGRKKKAF